MSHSEFRAMLELPALLAPDWRTGILILLLVTAAIVDYRSHRIPNGLVLCGVLFGVIYNIAFPPFPQAGFLWPFEGLGLGFIVFLPLHLLGGMGAGDVKLMAMVGAIIGPGDIISALLYTMIAGGVLSLLLVLVRGTAGRMFRNLSALFQPGYLKLLSGSRPDWRMDESASAGKLPYAIAIAIGTIACLILHPMGFL